MMFGIKPFMSKRNKKRFFALALVLLGATLLFLIFDKPPDLPAVMFLPPGPLAVKSGRVPDRWIPATWGWLHRTCQFFLGAPRQVGFKVQFMETSDTVASIVAQNSLGQPQAESNSVAVWIMPEKSIPKGIATFVSAARVITADQIEAKVLVSDGVAGHSADLFARLEKETVDLSTRLLVTDSAGQTNFVAAVRAQISYGQALLVLDVRHPESAANRLECVITADEYDAKGNIVQRKAGK
jgi:hypothetical protein